METQRKTKRLPNKPFVLTFLRVYMSRAVNAFISAAPIFGHSQTRIFAKSFVPPLRRQDRQTPALLVFAGCP